MAERRVGLIPEVVTVGGDSRAVLVTDRRIILVSEGPLVTGMREWLRYMFSDEPEDARRGPIDFGTSDIDMLAAMKGSMSMPLMSIRKVKFENTLGAYHITIEFNTEEGKETFEVMNIQPPAELIKANKAAGISTKETKRRYALKSQELVKRALPPMVSSESRWLK